MSSAANLNMVDQPEFACKFCTCQCGDKGRLETHVSEEHQEVRLASNSEDIPFKKDNVSSDVATVRDGLSCQLVNSEEVTELVSCDKSEKESVFGLVDLKPCVYNLPPVSSDAESRLNQERQLSLMLLTGSGLQFLSMIKVPTPEASDLSNTNEKARNLPSKLSPHPLQCVRNDAFKGPRMPYHSDSGTMKRRDLVKRELVDSIKNNKLTDVESNLGRLHASNVELEIDVAGKPLSSKSLFSQRSINKTRDPVRRKKNRLKCRSMKAARSVQERKLISDMFSGKLVARVVLARLPDQCSLENNDDAVKDCCNDIKTENSEDNVFVASDYTVSDMNMSHVTETNLGQCGSPGQCVSGTKMENIDHDGHTCPWNERDSYGDADLGTTVHELAFDVRHTDAFDISQKGCFSCWICLKKFMDCLAVKIHIRLLHSNKALYAMAQMESMEGNKGQSQMLLFCPKDCVYVTTKSDALSSHEARCQKQRLGPLTPDDPEIQNNLASREYVQERRENKAKQMSAASQASVPKSPAVFEKQPAPAMEAQADDAHRCHGSDSASLSMGEYSSDPHTTTASRKESQSVPAQGPGFLLNSVQDKMFDAHSTKDDEPHKPAHGVSSDFNSSDDDVIEEWGQGSSESLTKACSDSNGKIRPFQCEHCDKRFNLKSHLKSHRRTHTGEKPYKCDQCEKRFGRKDHLYVHFRTHTEEKPFECQQCGHKFSSKSGLQRHWRKHTGEKAPFECGECSKGFGDSNNLALHMRIHTGERPFKCDQCDKSFCRKTNLQEHLRRHAGEERTFQCGECGKVFLQKSSLQTHMRSHTGEKPFECSECGKRFNHRNSLRIHRRTHTGEKPFQCSECGRSFHYKNSFQVHLLSHRRADSLQNNGGGGGDRVSSVDGKADVDAHASSHPDTKQRPLSCDVCGKRFNHRNTLYAHKKLHSDDKPFKCETCDKSFHHSNSYKLHMRTHTGEKPFACQVCDKRFSRSHSLQTHFRVHTGEKPFECDHCGKRFALPGNLRLHKLVHTGDMNML